MNQAIPTYRVRLFGRAVVHAFSTRHGGVSSGTFASLNLSARVGDLPELVVENRRRLLESLGLRLEDTVALLQVHGNRVVEATGGDRGRGVVESAPLPEQADAMITRESGLGLLIVAADCVPVLFWDPVKGAIGAAHAGWRGTVRGVAARTLVAMAETFGTKAGDVLVGVGPAIGPCCYEVDEPVLSALEQAFPDHYSRVVAPAYRSGHGMLDLQEANRLQLLDAGVPESQIEVLGLCTACHRDQFYSERAEGRPSGRFGAVIALSG